MHIISIWSQGNGMKYDTNASFFQSIKETNNKQCLKKYIYHHQSREWTADSVTVTVRQ